MAQLDFSLTYSGIPFLSDDARAVRLTLDGSAQKGLQKQQPEGSLIADVERTFPFSWIAEFAPRNTLRDQTQLARQLQALDETCKVGVNQWYYPAGATSWSVFRGLATSSAVKAMTAATLGGLNPGTFTINSQPAQDQNNERGRTYGVTTSLYMLPPRPLGEQAGSFDGLYLVTLVDERLRWQYEPFVSLVDDATTWDSLITSLAASLGVTITYSTIDPVFTTPEPDSHLWNAHGDAAAILEAASLSIGRMLVRKYDGTYRLYTPAESVSLAASSRRNSTGVVLRLNGGDSFNSGGALPAGDLTQSKQGVLPQQVRLWYPKYVTGDDPVPHFIDRRGGASRWYEDGHGDAYPIDVPLQSGGAALSGLLGSGTRVIRCGSKALFAGESGAFYVSGVPSNYSGLNALAVGHAGAYLQSQIGTGLDECYLGILNWEPDGLHDLLFTHSALKRVASTRVMRKEWTAAVRDVQNATPDGPYQTGSAGRSVSLTVRDAGTALYMTNLLTFAGDATVSLGTVTSGGINEAVITVTASGAAGTDRLVTVTSGDTTPGPLVDKLVSLSGSVTFKVVNSGGNEKYDLEARQTSGPTINNYWFDWTWTEIDNATLYLLTQSGITTPKASVRIDSGSTISDIAGGESGRVMIVWNATRSGDHIAGVADEGAFSIGNAYGVNKIQTPLCRPYVMWPGDAVFLEYSTLSGQEGWRFDHPSVMGGTALGNANVSPSGTVLSGAVASGGYTYGLRSIKFGSGLAIHGDEGEDGGIKVWVAGGGGLGAACARAYNGSDVVIPNATYTAVDMPSADYDTNGFTNVSSGTLFFIATSGVYCMGSTLVFTNGALPANLLSVRLRIKGGAAFAQQDQAQVLQGGMAAPTAVSVCGTFKLSMGDIVEVDAYQDTGSDLPVTASSGYSPVFWINRVT